jgi:polysaccharide pyruvyl transferase WcaK-like protein
MNKIKLLGLLQDYFKADEKKRREEQDGIKVVIKKLKTKQRKIQKMLSECADEAMRKALQLEVDIITAQIDKGVEILKSFKQEESDKRKK